MTSRRVRLLLALAVLPLSVCSRGGGTSRVLYRHDQWQVGDVVTSTLSSSDHEVMTRVGADGIAVPQRDATRRVEASWLEKAVGVDPDGTRTRYLVWIRDWRRTEGNDVDHTLKGVYVAVSGTGGDRAWSFLDKALAPSDAAKQWLDTSFGARRLDDFQMHRMIFPDTPVAVGASWHPNVEPLVDWTARNHLTVDRSKMTATATLTAVEGGEARVRFDTSLPLSKVPESTVPWTKGGTILLTTDLRVPLEGRLLLDSHRERHATLDGEASVEGATLRIASQLQETLERSLGGEFPQPPEGAQ